MGRMALAAVGAALLLGGCGSDEEGSPGSREPAQRSITIDSALPRQLTEIQIRVGKKFEPGKDVAVTWGCIGCQKIGESGGGPGPELTEIGANLPRGAIARTLIDPKPPMPVYSKLRQKHPKQFEQLVDFLS